MIVPAHELTIRGERGKIAGRCRCGWNATRADHSDDVSRQFVDEHLARMAQLELPLTRTLEVSR